MAKATQAENDEAALLQRKARRRLVGAIAIALFAVIVIPIVFDKEPRPITQDLVVDIPSQDSSKFNPKLLPQPPATEQAPTTGATPPAADPATAPVVPAVPAAQAGPAKTGAASAEKPAAVEPAKPEASKPQVTAKAESSKAESPKAESAKASAAPEKAAQGETFIVPLGAFANPANAKQVQTRVAAAGFKSYSEKMKGAKGDQLRVRAGPFPTREAAERAREKLKSLGFNPVGAVALREAS